MSEIIIQRRNSFRRMGPPLFRSVGISKQQQVKRAAMPAQRRQATICAAAAVQTKTLKIGTRGSPLALAQAYLTRDLLKVGALPRWPSGARRVLFLSPHSTFYHAAPQDDIILSCAASLRHASTLK